MLVELKKVVTARGPVESVWINTRKPPGRHRQDGLYRGEGDYIQPHSCEGGYFFRVRVEAALSQAGHVRLSTMSIGGGTLTEDPSSFLIVDPASVTAVDSTSGGDRAMVYHSGDACQLVDGPFEWVPKKNGQTHELRVH